MKIRDPVPDPGVARRVIASVAGNSEDTQAYRTHRKRNRLTRPTSDDDRPATKKLAQSMYLEASTQRDPTRDVSQ